jgi:hypothetical protein
VREWLVAKRNHVIVGVTLWRGTVKRRDHAWAPTYSNRMSPLHSTPDSYQRIVKAKKPSGSKLTPNQGIVRGNTGRVGGASQRKEQRH